jgi:putative oxidoreductase
MSEIPTTPEAHAPSRAPGAFAASALSRGVDRARAGLTSASFIAPLLTRVVLGMAFFQAGYGKWQHMDGTTDFFAGLGIPLPGANAMFIATLEMVGGALLIPGIASRVWAFLLSATMVVALITAHPAEFVTAWAWSSETAPLDVTAFAFLLFLSWLLFFGPGAASVDRLLSRWLIPSPSKS